MCAELKAQGISFETQVEIPVLYRDVWIRCGYRLDLLIEKQLIVEIKAVEALVPIHDAQLLTYLRLTKLRIGLLLNFNTPVLRNGIKRISL